MKTRFFTSLLMLVAAHTLSAQQISLATNAVEYLNLGAMNGEVSVSLGRHLTLAAGASYNPWNFGSEENGYLQNRLRNFSLGMRYWPWHAYSGWWVALKGQYQEYNRGGFFGSQKSEEGDAWGSGLSFGYALMLSRHFNLDFGVGAWAGRTAYTTYACPRCGRVLDSGNKTFLKPDDMRAAIVYVF